jgi:hypothetical protein
MQRFPLAIEQAFCTDRNRGAFAAADGRRNSFTPCARLH